MSRTATIAQDESPVGRVDTFLRGWLTTNPGEMLPPELDLVDRLGVSRSTVRTVLKQLEAQGLVQCLGRRQGRRAATSRPQQRGVWAKTVLVISPALDPAKYARTGWLEAIEAGAMDALRQQGLYGLLMDSAGIPDILADAQRLPLGALAVRAADPAHTVLPLHRAGVTTAVFGTQAELAAIDQVYTDQAAGCQLLCDYLITQRGRKRLLRLWTPQDNPWWLRLRDEGYARAIAAAGLTPLPIVNVPPAVTNGKPLEELHDKIRIYTGFLAEYLLGPEPVDKPCDGLGQGESAVEHDAGQKPFRIVRMEKGAGRVQPSLVATDLTTQEILYSMRGDTIEYNLDDEAAKAKGNVNQQLGGAQ